MKTCKLNNTLLNNTQVKDIKEEIKLYLETDKNGNTTYTECDKSNSKKEVHKTK